LEGLFRAQNLHSRELTMPRAKRNYLPGYAWHLTHRCHNRDFLLKFERDRARWRHWLREAKKRYGLVVLDYIVTSNHVHLLVYDRAKTCIARSMQLVAGRVAQEYNCRKSRRGAFWEDRYYATAVATGRHLARCIVYIDLNMVRAGVVKHPSHWKVCGYSEIQSAGMRYRIIDLDALCVLTETSSPAALRQSHRRWVEEALEHEGLTRQPDWTETVAVGPDSFVRRFRCEKARSKRHKKAS
jgi:putative transposase